MQNSDVDFSQEISLREAARAQSSTGSVGTTTKCFCGGKCSDKRCQFFKNGLKCNSRCHGVNVRCVNRDT